MLSLTVSNESIIKTTINTDKSLIVIFPNRICSKLTTILCIKTSLKKITNETYLNAMFKTTDCRLRIILAKVNYNGQ